MYKVSGGSSTFVSQRASGSAKMQQEDRSRSVKNHRLAANGHEENIGRRAYGVTWVTTVEWAYRVVQSPIS